MTLCSDTFLQIQSRERPPQVPSDETYSLITDCLKGKFPTYRNMTKEQQSVAKKVKRHDIKLENIDDPLTGDRTEHLTSHGLIIPKETDVDGIIKSFRKETISMYCW